MPTDVISIGTAITHLIAIAVGAFVGVGFSLVTLLAFMRGVLNSPVLLKAVEGLVNSFPPETRELINLLGKLLETISDGVDMEIEALNDEELDG